MSATSRLTVAGLRRRGVGQMLVLALVAALAAAAIVAGLAAQTSAADLVDAAYERANHPDLVLYGSPEELRRVADDPAVAEASEPAPRLLAGTVDVDGDPIEFAATAVDPAALPAVGAPELVEGRWPDEGADDEIVVEQSLIADGVVDVGDEMVLDQPDGSTTLRVVGAAIDLTDCFWPTCDPLRAFASADTITRLNDGAPPERSVAAFRLVDPEQAEEVHTRMLGDAERGLGGSSWPDTRGDILVIGGVFSAMVGGFGLFLLASACLVVAGATAARLVARRRSFGLLKAVGFRPSQLATSVLAEHLAIGAVGVVAGWAVGSMLAPAVQPGVDGVVGDAAAAFEVGPLLVALVLVEAFLTVSVVVPAWRAGRQPATEVLRDAPPTPNGGRRIAALARGLGAGPSLVAGLRRAFARPVRAILAGGAIVVAVTGAVVAAGFLHSLDEANDEPARIGEPWDAYAFSTGASPAAIEDGLARTPEVASWYTEQDTSGTVDDGTYAVRVVGGEPGAAAYVVQEGRGMLAPDETMVGYGFLDATGLDVGDTVTVDVDDRALVLEIVGWYTEFEDSGEVIQVRAEALDAASLLDEPTFRLSAAESVSGEALADAVSDRFDGDVSAAPRGSGDGGLGAINGALVSIAAVLAAVAFANLLAVTVAATRERARALGVLRTVGCTTGQLVRQSAAGAGAIGFVAGLLGVPIGSFVFTSLSDGITTGVGVGPGLAVSPSSLFLVALVPIAALVAAGAGALATLGLVRRPAADLVRYE